MSHDPRQFVTEIYPYARVETAYSRDTKGYVVCTGVKTKHDLEEYLDVSVRDTYDEAWEMAAEYINVIMLRKLES